VRELEIESESITLAQLLKLVNLVGSGGEARQFLAETVVRVNGEPDARRGRKLRPGDVVEAAGESIRVTAAG
jgi:ribosome-associated protein